MISLLESFISALAFLKQPPHSPDRDSQQAAQGSETSPIELAAIRTGTAWFQLYLSHYAEPFGIWILTEPVQ
jgi:hypothetical protein